MQGPSVQGNKGSTAPAGNSHLKENVTEEEEGILTEVNEKFREIYSRVLQEDTQQEGHSIATMGPMPHC